jgi:hypothetical protein
MAPGFRLPAAIGPMRVRRRRAVGWAIASHIRRTCRFFPLTQHDLEHGLMAVPAADDAQQLTRAGSVRRPSIGTPRRSRSRSRSSGTPSTSASYVRSSS